MSKMRRNLIKIRSCAIFSWFRFSIVTLRSINVFVFDWLVKFNRLFETMNLINGKNFFIITKGPFHYIKKSLPR